MQPVRPSSLLVVLFVAMSASLCAAENRAPGHAGQAVDGGLPEVLDLDTAQRIAIESNPSVEAARARIDQARARVKQAQSAYLPSLDFTAGASKTWLAENDYRAARNGAFVGAVQGFNQVLGAPSAGGVPLVGDVLGLAQAVAGPYYARGSVDNSVDSYNAGLTATWLIFDGLAREFSNAAARLGRREAEALHGEVQRQLLAGVAGAFYNVQLQRENIEIAQENLRFNQRLLKEAKARRRVGAGSLSDELNFEVRVRAAESSLLQVEKGRNVARIGLAALMGVPDAALGDTVQVAVLTAEAPEELAPPQDTAGLIQRGLASRPEIIQSDYAVERADAGIGSRRAAFFPVLSAFASRDSRQSDAFKLGEDDCSTTVGVNVSLNLFAGGRKRAAVAEAKAARTEAERNRDSAAIAVASEIREAVEEVVAAQKELVLQRTNAEYVQRNRSLVEKEYKAGQTSLVRLNEAQRDLVQAQVGLALARVSLRNAWHALRSATAETLAAYAQ